LTINPEHTSRSRFAAGGPVAVSCGVPRGRGAQSEIAKAARATPPARVGFRASCVGSVRPRRASVRAGAFGPAFHPVREDRSPMRLKKLILQGFKSFADRTEFV